MAIINIWVFPIFISLYSVLCLLSCVILSIYFHHFPAHWPYLSDFAKYIPAKNAYTIMTNHILLLLLIWMYLKHRELKSFFRQTGCSHYYEKISWINFFIGILAITSLQLAVNFPSTKVNYFEVYGNKLALVLGMIYIWCHSFLSKTIRGENLPSSKLIFLVRISLAAIVSSCFVAMIQFNKMSSQAKKDLALDAIYEWGCYFAFCSFLLTDSYEFRFMVFRPPKLIIRGSIGYNERVFDSTDVSDDDNESIPPMSRRFVN